MAYSTAHIIQTALVNNCITCVRNKHFFCRIYDIPRKSNEEKVNGAFNLRSLFSVVDLKLSVVILLFNV